MRVKKGSSDVITYFKLVDPTSGDEETGLTIANLDMSYVRDQASHVKVDATSLGALTNAHSDNKMFEVDSTDCKGLYRADWQDAAFASGVDRVQLIISGAAIDTAVMEVELIDNTEKDIYDIANNGTYGNAKLARTGAAGDTLESLSGQADNQATAVEQAKVPKSDNTVVWNATAQATIQTKAAAALTVYNPPTKTEMDTGHGLLATVSKQDVIDGIVDNILLDTDALQKVIAINKDTAQAGASTTITLAAGETSVTDFYKRMIIVIIGGTGVGQARYVSAYNGTSKVATVTNAWSTNPANDSVYVFLSNDISGAGDASEAKQDEILVDLVDIKGTGFVKDTDSLVDLFHTGADSDTGKTISDQMDGIGSQAGAGAITWVHKVTVDPGGADLADVDVWVTSDEAGTNTIASGKTDQNGEVTFYLDAGTVYVWRQKSGYNFTNPDEDTVVAP